MLLMLALEDIKSFTIPDKLSFPMIVMTLIIIAFSWGLYAE
jgi:Flp pilus assembly protein protease CpaA